MSEPQTQTPNAETQAAPTQAAAAPRTRGPMSEEDMRKMKERSAARAVIVDLMERGKLPKEATKALKVLDFRRPKRRGLSGVAGVTMNDQLEAMEKMLVEGPVSHMEFYQKFRLGPSDMKNRIRVLLATRRGDKRPWIALDENKDSETFDHYKIIARGDEVPDPWDGYIPEDIKERMEVEQAKADAATAEGTKAAEATE